MNSILIGNFWGKKMKIIKMKSLFSLKIEKQLFQFLGLELFDLYFILFFEKKE